MGSWRKGLKSKAEFIFLDAPHIVPSLSLKMQKVVPLKVDDVDDVTAHDAGGRSWWLWDDRDETPRPSKSKKYTEWHPSLELVSETLQHHGPFDGLLGFSQGATLAALFLASVQTGKIVCDQVPRFAIFVAGFVPHDEKVAKEIADAGLSIDSLHIHGTTDTFVSRGALDMTTVMECIRVLNHADWHNQCF